MDLAGEWLEADGEGGFASGTVSGERTRRYHALLLTATTPPTGRVVLVNGAETWIDTGAGCVFLSTQRYRPGVLYPDGFRRIVAFSRDPWPCWTFAQPEGQLTQEILSGRGSGTVLRWTWLGSGPCLLSVRLLLSGRDSHATHHENPSFEFSPRGGDGAVTWRPYASLPEITATGNFAYRHAPDWYRGFLYAEEQARGLDCIEDLAAPGILSWDLAAGPATLLLQPGSSRGTPGDLMERERARRSGRDLLDRDADQYLVKRGEGLSLVAGYPWFTDWGRDTFIAMRGLLLAGSRFEEAGRILMEWAGTVSEGMLPNRFTDHGEVPEYNAVDASLWFVVAAAEYLAHNPGDAARLRPAMEAVLAGYAQGTRYGIALDADGLLRSGAPGVALTWMDARIDGKPVTPRRGKPVEVQALWINALHIGAAWSPRWAALETRALASFRARFPDPASGGLRDTIDPEDFSVRPNQIFAVGGLPLRLLELGPARRVVDLVEARLLTPLGLRTLEPGAPGYAAHYQGGPAARDAAYHQGTVWPWLMGPFIEAWLRVHGDSAERRAEARSRFLAPLLAQRDQDGLGGISELADAEPPHRPGGCPFQAWSLGELIRMDSILG